MYSFGVGRDLSWDTALVELFGCAVHAFDPTPRSAQWVAQQRLHPNISFHQLGLGAKDGVLKFEPPANPEFVSYHRADDSSGPVVECKVSSLQNIQTSLNHPKVNVVKLDIEGMEYEVVDSLATLETLPDQILIEFHHYMYPNIKQKMTDDAIKTLENLDYVLCYEASTGREKAFIRSEILA